MTTRTGVAVALPTLVYAWPKTKEDFDMIATPETIHDWEPCSTTTLLKGDGQKWERRCHSKSVGGDKPGDVMVVFQWFDERPLQPTAGERK